MAAEFTCAGKQQQVDGVCLQGVKYLTQPNPHGRETKAEQVSLSIFPSHAIFKSHKLPSFSSHFRATTFLRPRPFSPKPPFVQVAGLHPLQFLFAVLSDPSFVLFQMTRLFGSKSSVLDGISDPCFHSNREDEEEDEDEDEEYHHCEESLYELDESSFGRETRNLISTPFISPASRADEEKQSNQYPILDILAAALRKSLVTCSVETDDISSMDISSPVNVSHVSHVTFDRFNGFLGLPSELQPHVPRRVPSASASVFGVSAKSMQCLFDNRGNSVPAILLRVQKRLYAEGGLQAEGIFRINPENSQEKFVREQLDRGMVPRGIDVHCLAGLIKAWFRELPTGVLDSLTPEQVMHCNTEDDCNRLIKLLPPTEAALLDWAINLMTDVAQNEQYNKMNARNIAMVFAPNMTQMADPLTALIHAVQVMNLLKTLILINIREREESDVKNRLFFPSLDESNQRSDHTLSSSSLIREELTENNIKTTSSARFQSDGEEKFHSFQEKRNEEEEFESISGRSTPPSQFELGSSRNRFREGYEFGDWLSLRRVRKLCRHPVIQLSKAAKKTRKFGSVNAKRRGEAWA